MKRVLTIAVLCAVATLVQAQTKKELVAKVLLLQQPMIENISRSIVERPAAQLMQAAGQALQTQVPPEKREAIGKSVEADVKKFVEEATPILRERAIKLAPSTFGASLEEKFTDAELKQLIAWLESPVNKKFQQVGPEMQNNFVQKLAAEAAPLLEPKLQALQQKLRATFSVADGSAPAGATPASAAAAKPVASSPAKASK
jgi:uncharacterized protein